MKKEDLELERIGGDGIDTEYERGLINYRPDIKYNPRKETTEYNLYDVNVELSEGAETKTKLLWTQAVAIAKLAEELEKKLEEKLKDAFAPIPAKYLNMVQQAAKNKFNVDISDTIPFDLYKKTFNYPDSGEAVMIQDVFEDYQADVNGELNAELYPDVIEIKQDWNDMIGFINRGLFAQIVPVENVPTKLEADDEKANAIYEAEQKMVDDYTNSLRMDKMNEEIYDHLTILEYGSERYYAAEYELREGMKNTKKLERRLFTKSEISDLVEAKAENVRRTLGLISNSIDFKPYKDKEYDILYHILKQYKTKGEVEKGLMKVQTLIKLSVDHKKDRTNESRNNLRGLAGRNTKQKISNNLVNGVHLRNEVFGEVHDLLNYFDGAPNNKGFEIVASHIADSVMQADAMYLEQAGDFHKINQMESSMRKDKIAGLIDKDASRSIYKIMGKVIEHVNEKGKWSDEADLSAWLSDFMEQYQF